VVKKMAGMYPSGPYVFVGDSFFSSVDLVQSMEKQGRYYVGTIRYNRKYSIF